MSVTERALDFECEGETLVGVASLPPRAAATGVVIVVGGPQYRAGAHRQFVLLARRLAAAGHAVLRFDYRGMGDSGGPMRGFDAVDADIAAALDALGTAAPGVRTFVLWGLCDGASAAAIYASRDSRVAGLVLLNPWIRSDASLARARLKHYYWRRLADAGFWRKALRLRFSPLRSLREIAGFARQAGAREPGSARPFQARMLAGLERSRARVLTVLSGRDLTAQEFVEYVGARPAWRRLLASERCERIDLAAADHTFSDPAWREEVERVTVDWLRRHFGPAPAHRSGVET